MKIVFTTAVTISMHTSVDASSIEEAVEIAQGRGSISLCHYCSGGAPTREWVTSGELDGVPAESSLVDVDIEGDPVSPEQFEAISEKWGQ